MNWIVVSYLIIAGLVTLVAYRFAHRPSIWRDLQGVLGWFGNDQHVKQACVIVGLAWPYVAVRIAAVIFDVIIDEMTGDE